MKAERIFSLPSPLFLVSPSLSPSYKPLPLQRMLESKREGKRREKDGSPLFPPLSPSFFLFPSFFRIGVLLSPFLLPSCIS